MLSIYCVLSILTIYISLFYLSVYIFHCANYRVGVKFIILGANTNLSYYTINILSNFFKPNHLLIVNDVNPDVNLNI